MLILVMIQSVIARYLIWSNQLILFASMFPPGLWPPHCRYSVLGTEYFRQLQSCLCLNRDKTRETGRLIRAGDKKVNKPGLYVFEPAQGFLFILACSLSSAALTMHSSSMGGSAGL